jgi:8-hydroxy-5-deazaflavin:NADPH oxidoreductase
MESTRVGVIGSGGVGRSLAAGFRSRGHDVVLGTRDPGSAADDLRAWSDETGVPLATFADTAQHGELVVLAVKGTAVEEAIEQAGRERFAGKVVIDATNPLDFSGGGPALAVGHADSGGEIVQRAIPDARVVKAFNTVNSALMADPGLPDGPHPMFIAGDDEDAKRVVSEILDSFGWKAFDVGGIDQSRQLESIVILWVAIGQARGAWDHAFTLVTP